MKEFKPDLANYHKMSQPHENSDKANEALEKFYEKVAEARKEFKISDVLVVTMDTVFSEIGTITAFVQVSQFGNVTNGLSMAAYAFGKLKAEQNELLSHLLEENDK